MQQYAQRVGLPILLCLLGVNPWGQRARACISTDSDGEGVPIAAESAVIVWDEARHTEHFIRQATFNTTASDFGFIVPTPSLPTLAAADPAVFNLLQQLAPLSPKAVGAISRLSTQTATAQAKVNVLKTQRVAGYDAVVLKAENLPALRQWLAGHGYKARRELTSWLSPYVANHWCVTAFKVARRNQSDHQTSNALVRMTFSAPHPFYPYREPPSKPDPAAPSRLLRVFLFSDGPMQGTLGYNSAQLWPGQVTTSQWMPASRHAALAQDLALPPQQLPANLWLTAFEDYSSPRHGTADVYFAPASNRALHLLQASAVLGLGLVAFWFSNKKYSRRVFNARYRASHA